MPFVAKRVFDHEPVMIAPEWGLRDLKPGMAYSLCNSLQCISCGVVFLDLRFSDTEMTSLYAGYREEEYTNLREFYEPGYKGINEFYSGRAAYIDTIEEFLLQWVPSPHGILDWGGDTGINTPLIKQAHLAHIYDISNKPVISGVEAVDLATIKRNKYDMIICSQMLEHVPYPKDVLDDIISVMDADTLLYLEVPYEELILSQPSSRELYKEKHHWHEHINFFSMESLVVLIEQAGLRLLEMKPIKIDLGWRNACVISVLCRLA